MTLSDRFTLLRNQQDAVLGRRGNLTGISAKNRTAAQETRLRQQRQNAVAARRQNLKGRGPGGAKMPAPVAKNGSAAGTRGGKAGRGRGGARAGGRGGKAARGNNKPERRPEAQQKKTKKQKKQKGPKGPKGGKAGAGAGGGDVSLAELDAQLASYNHEGVFSLLL